MSHLIFLYCLLSASGPGVSSVPLQQKTAPSTTLFQELPATASGVQFINHLARPNHVPFINTGAGLALDDYDGDGLTDIYLLSTDSPNKLFRQKASFQFEDTTALAGVDGGPVWSRGAAFADVNGDGLTDLYVCNTEAPNLLYINRGDGTFIESAHSFGLDVVAASIMAYFADYDRDGDLDMYLVTYRVLKHNLTPGQVADIVIPAGTAKSRQQMMVHQPPSPTPLPDSRVAPDQWEDKGRGRWELAGQRDILFRNDGDRFTDVTQTAGLTDFGLGLAANWLDYNGDGWLDLYVGNDLTNPDRLWRNRGDGTFEDVLEKVMPHTTWYSMGMDSADLNNDGLIDLMVADMAGSNHYRAKVGMGDMSSSLWFLNNEWPRQKMQNAVFLNTGTDRFQEIGAFAGLAATDWTWAVKLADLDNDGRIDVFTTNGTARDDMNIDLVGIAMMKVWEEKGKEAAMEYMKTIPAAPSPDFAFRNLGDMKFKNVSADWGLDHSGIGFGAAFADFDRDGDLDLVVNRLGEEAGVYRNNSQEGHRVIFRLIGLGGNKRAIGATLKLNSATLGLQIRQLLPARGFMSSDEPLLHFGLGKDEAITQLEINWPDGSSQHLENLAADRFYTITQTQATPTPTKKPTAPQFVAVSPDQGLSWRHRETPYDDFALQPLLPGKLSQLGPGLAWGDANNDGFDDVYLAGAAGQPGQLLLRSGEGFVAKSGPMANHAASEGIAPLWLDVDSDGDLDLFVASGSNEHLAGDRLQQDRLYLNDGQANFTFVPDALPGDAHFSGATATADIDGDGDLDLFVGSRAVPGRYPIPPISRLLLNEGGRFQDVTHKLAPGLRSVGLVSSALFSDVDADGKPDLLLALEWGPISYFHNKEGHFQNETQAAGLAERTGWWNSIASADFNGDGFLDYVVMNLGHNSKYKASPQKPSLLYYGDMDGSGTAHLIEAKKVEEGLLPVRGRSCSSGAMPLVAKKFPTFHDFAEASLPEIYTPNKLDGALRLEATEFDSGVLIGNGKGAFTWKPLPWQAQIFPGYGVVTSDLDGDGRCDIYTIGNFFTREPETGLLDGCLGLMLRGDGKGGFSAVSPTETGIRIVGDGKGLTQLDLDRDGWPDLVATQNDGLLLGWRNRGLSSRTSLSIRLLGPNGNPQAVGAKVFANNADGSLQTTELHAGGGYLSQSPAIVFLGTSAMKKEGALRIIWPDGAETRHTLEQLTGQIIIKHPSIH